MVIFSGEGDRSQKPGMDTNEKKKTELGLFYNLRQPMNTNLLLFIVGIRLLQYAVDNIITV